MDCEISETLLEENEYFFTCKASMELVRNFKYFQKKEILF